MEMKKEQQNENEEQINKNSQLMISVVGVFGKRRKVSTYEEFSCFVLEYFRKTSPDPFKIYLQKRSKPPIDIPPN